MIRRLGIVFEHFLTKESQMLKLVNLDSTVRAEMLAEVEADIAAGKLYLSPRFNTHGQKLYPDMLRDAVQNHDDGWLSTQLRSRDCFNSMEIRNTKNGPVSARVPVNAADVMAEGEFNRFYLRGLCRVALDRSIASLVVYRARESDNPRPESVAMIGKAVDPHALLTDLRTNTFVDTALRLPPGPNSGLSARLP